jgi:aminomethyltransferase
LTDLDDGTLQRLHLHDLHQSLGGKMVPFAGYLMPVQYPAGVMKEHLHTRAAAGLFDVSHMGQVILQPKGTMPGLLAELETLMPVDARGLPPGRQRYGLLLTKGGGIIDDLMFANRGDHVLMVVNAARKAVDIAHLASSLQTADVLPVTDRGLFALQGPRAEDVLADIVPAVRAMRFMDVIIADSRFGTLWISRSGYTGEDGFEISVATDSAEALARALLAHPEVAPIGLGARDSLRLEAGLCLYGHDMDEFTSPTEAGLNWAIPKVRREGGARMGGFPGWESVVHEIDHGSHETRVGLRPEGRAPMREDTYLYNGEKQVARITSGGFGPSVGGPIAMARVPTELSAPGTNLLGYVRGKYLPVTVVPLPFHPTSYKR